MDVRKRVAIMYDFDETLAPGNMQEYAFIPNLEIDAGEFWNHCAVLAKEHNKIYNIQLTQPVNCHIIIKEGLH